MTSVAARAGAARNGHCLQNCPGWLVLVLVGLPFDTTLLMHVKRVLMHFMSEEY